MSFYFTAVVVHPNSPVSLFTKGDNCRRKICNALTHRELGSECLKFYSSLAHFVFADFFAAAVAAAAARRAPSRAHSITMNSLHAHLLLLAVCCVGYIASSPVIGQDQRSGDSDADVLLAADEMADNGGDNIDKRVERYAFGLGRRAYMYTNGGPGMKRLPVYNFGLGKRSRPYSFGLGKRSDYDYDQDNEIDYRVPPANYLAAERAGKSTVFLPLSHTHPFNPWACSATWPTEQANDASATLQLWPGPTLSQCWPPLSPDGALIQIQPCAI